MTDESPKPKIKRWRWIIAGVLLFTGWWYWPRGDARFVGKWADVETEEEGPLFYLDLSSNGMGKWRGVDGTPSLPFSWRVEGDRFIHGSPRYLDRPWIRSLADYCGYHILPEKSCRIIEAGEDRIRLEWLFELKLRRLPD